MCGIIFSLKKLLSRKKTQISKSSLNCLRNEFHYWYPVDLRVSGKDLVPNHLTYYLYNHTAMWSEPVQWPKGIRANGHLLLNSEKMAKSTGNFLTLSAAIERYSADGMRLALADSGDSVEDGNFVENVADAGILRLFTFVEWVKEVIATKDMRNDGEKTFHDRVFLSEMNQKIAETEKNYENMQFKEALRTGFFELQQSRDKYRELCGGLSGMYKELVMKFIKIQAVLLSPICPHVAEYIWSDLLSNKNSILNEKWPVVGEIDQIVIKSSDYLMEAARDFRLKLKNYTVPIKNKKGGPPLIKEKPTHATIYVAKTYPAWQCTVLTKLKEMYSKNPNEVPDNKSISQELGKIADLKKWMKKVMPFVQFTKERISSVGMSALDLTLEFDEKQVLMDNLSYITNDLLLEGIEVIYSSDAGDKIQEECRPGNPFIQFRTDPSVTLMMLNNQPRSGVFQIKMNILQGDTPQTIATRLHRMEMKNIKDPKKVKLYRFDDPELGPRKIPSIDDPMEGKSLIDESDSIFNINVDKSTVELQTSKGKFPIGCQIVYNI